MQTLALCCMLWRYNSCIITSDWRWIMHSVKIPIARRRFEFNFRFRSQLNWIEFIAYYHNLLQSQQHTTEAATPAVQSLLNASTQCGIIFAKSIEFPLNISIMDVGCSIPRWSNAIVPHDFIQHCLPVCIVMALHFKCFLFQASSFQWKKHVFWCRI